MCKTPLRAVSLSSTSSLSLILFFFLCLSQSPSHSFLLCLLPVKSDGVFGCQSGAKICVSKEWEQARSRPWTGAPVPRHLANTVLSSCREQQVPHKDQQRRRSGSTTTGGIPRGMNVRHRLHAFEFPFKYGDRLQASIRID